MTTGGPLLPPYRPSRLAAGSSGEWSLLDVHLPERATNLIDTKPACFRYRPGHYTELRQGGITYMTDLYDEWWTQRSAIVRARTLGGSVLITGLGLGMVVEAILAEPTGAEVGQVTVIEQSADVIALVGPQLCQRCGPRLHIVHADAYTWTAPSGMKYDTVWHDIWPDPDAAEVDAQIEALARHHERWSRSQGFWPHDYRAALHTSSPQATLT